MAPPYPRGERAETPCLGFAGGPGGNTWTMLTMLLLILLIVLLVGRIGPRYYRRGGLPRGPRRRTVVREYDY